MPAELSWMRFAVTLSLTALATMPCGAQCSYFTEVIQGAPCPPFGDPAPITVQDIASDGTVVGWIDQCYPNDEHSDGFVWRGESFQVIPRPAGVVDLTADAINSRGDVLVNMQIDCSNCWYLSFVYRDGQFVPVGVLPTGNYSIGASINDEGIAVGYSGSVAQPGVPSFQHAFIGLVQPVIDIGAQLKTQKSALRDVSNTNVAVGYVEYPVPDVITQAFSWEDGRVEYLGFLPGGHSSGATSVNDYGVVAGGASAPSDTGMYIGHAVVWNDGIIIDLGTLPGYANCSAYDINNHAVVVGAAWTQFATDAHGFVWSRDLMRDLNELVEPMNGLIVERAVAINDAGQIAARGKLGNHFIGLRLTPKPASPADLTGDCRVDGEDLMILLKSWGPVKSQRNATPAADLDNNGIVNGYDLATLLAAWG